MTKSITAYRGFIITLNEKTKAYDVRTVRGTPCASHASLEIARGIIDRGRDKQPDFRLIDSDAPDRILNDDYVAPEVERINDAVRADQT